MKVDHITIGGNAVIRDTKDIEPQTKDFFKDFSKGNIISKIDQTPFVCKVTLQNGLAAFDLSIGNNLLCTSLCCFARKDRETIITYAKELGRNIRQREVSLLTPRKDQFIYTLVVNPSAPSEYLQLAAEIELYIYNAIYDGIRLRESSIRPN